MRSGFGSRRFMNSLVIQVYDQANDPLQHSLYTLGPQCMDLYLSYNLLILILAHKECNLLNLGIANEGKDQWQDLF